MADEEGHQAPVPQPAQNPQDPQNPPAGQNPQNHNPQNPPSPQKPFTNCSSSTRNATYATLNWSHFKPGYSGNQMKRWKHTYLGQMTGWIHMDSQTKFRYRDFV